MAISEYRKIQIEQRELDRQLENIVDRKIKERKDASKVSYCMHTPRAVLRRLGDRSRPRTWL